MLSFEISPHPRYTAYTATHLWYSDGRVLYRFHLASNVIEKIHAFPTDIRCITTNDDRCIVVTGNRGKCTLWRCEAPWTQIAHRVSYWVLTPHRLVFERQRRVKSWDFATTILDLVRGHLLGASDRRILYEDSGQKWQDGTSAEDVKYLWSNDRTLMKNESSENRGRKSSHYWVMSTPERAWRNISSRVAVRLERLIGRDAASQLLTHA